MTLLPRPYLIQRAKPTLPMKFSERTGIVAPRTAIQLGSMDKPLRTALWNALTLTYFEYAFSDPVHGVSYPLDELKHLMQALWANHLDRSLDTLPRRWDAILSQVRDYFFNAEWYQVYDLIEFCPKHFENEDVNNRFRGICTHIMEREKAGYRFVADEISEITSPEEIASIEESLEFSGKFGVVSEHMATALRMLSDRREPDYRNSIKESISAVESIASIIADRKTADLGPALKVLEQRKTLHGALKSAFGSLYGFTSDANGVRHALLEESNLTFADAKFMLVACSAFVNYLKEVGV
jgi:hypothetical protein